MQFFFETGMSMREAFTQIEHQPNIYDVVHVKYHDEVGSSNFLILIM